METQTYLAFLALVAVVLVTPGPSVTLSLVHGAKYGAGRAGLTALGDISANMIQMIAAVAGLGLILSQSAILFSIIKVAGVAYLAWLGFSMIRRSFNGTAPSHDLPATRGLTPFGQLRQGFVVAGTSPKAILFYGALFPQFIDPTMDVLPQFLLLAATCAFLDFCIIWAYGALAALGAERMQGDTASRWVDRLGGTAMLAAAGHIARLER
ncbi:LysE family translocator [Gymnodinialimonas hymeniacidonis]|uniref:LysE family translocator n=1 Tax=Gymnodinialimonas hymeniacidonis TaxID=3126508 RepID=UPI0034C62AF8